MQGGTSRNKLSLIDRWIEKISLGPALVTISAMAFLIALNRGIALLYGAAALTLAAAVIGYLYPRINLPKLRLQRKTPGVAHAGDSINVRLEISSERFLPAWMLTIREALPFLTFAEQPRVLLSRFRKQHWLTYSLHCAVRGEFYFGEPRVSTGFPFGLIEKSAGVVQSLDRLLVYPVPFDIHHFPMREGRSNAMDEQISSLPNNGHQEFHSIREYHYGDPPRHINWHHYARRSALAVNQYGNPVDSSLHLVLDANTNHLLGGKVHNTFEDAITIALSASRYALDLGASVGITVPGSGGNVLKPRSGAGQYLSIREMLTRVKAEDDRPFSAVAAAAIEEVPTASQHVLFCLDRDLPGLSRFLNDPACIFICFNSLSYESQLEASTKSAWAPSGRLLNVHHGALLSHAFH